MSVAIGIPVEGGVFYPSHLAKGLVAGTIAIVAGGVALAFGAVAVHELSRVGKDVYPEVFRMTTKSAQLAEVVKGG
jgi:hypothetical protein